MWEQDKRSAGTSASGTRVPPFCPLVHPPLRPSEAKRQPVPQNLLLEIKNYSEFPSLLLWATGMDSPKGNPMDFSLPFSPGKGQILKEND